MNELQQATARAIVNVFETGRIRGNYAEITVLKGDSGHLSYGRSQAALGSGSLYELINAYCQQPNARFADELRPHLPRFQAKDVSLDTDDSVKGLLKAAGAQDPVMRVTQDQYFNRAYFAPACRAAEALGIAEPLGQAVVYDSHIQGGWGLLKKRIGPVTARGERDWVQKFIELRTQWLKSLKPPLPNTVYRMDSFAALIAQGKWDLALPLAVHGVTLTSEALAGDIATPEAGPRTLQLASPYLRGADVSALQRALTAQGLPIPDDGVYGPFTDVMVKKWQAQQGIAEVGVAKQTRASLGL